MRQLARTETAALIEATIKAGNRFFAPEELRRFDGMRKPSSAFLADNGEAFAVYASTRPRFGEGEPAREYRVALIRAERDEIEPLSPACATLAGAEGHGVRDYPFVALFADRAEAVRVARAWAKRADKVPAARRYPRRVAVRLTLDEIATLIGALDDAAETYKLAAADLARNDLDTDAEAEQARGERCEALIRDLEAVAKTARGEYPR